MRLKQAGILLIAISFLFGTGCQNKERELFKENLDKGEKYLYSLQYERSFEYLQSANQIFKAGFKASAKDKSKLFACLSAIYVWKKDIQNALFYAQNAWNVEKEGKIYGYLYARLLFAVDKEEESLAVFRETYSLFPDRADQFSLKTYEHLKNKYKSQDRNGAK
ncbi:hypothetical protein [Treponema pectinovorum]|uniref:hypothetical protein n=1 Tax=Treponema pectinovorum TaxID=164 RepID=UPI0011CAB643|nr:hypothetical protein [Treponema pectinovorum]